MMSPLNIKLIVKSLFANGSAAKFASANLRNVRLLSAQTNANLNENNKFRYTNANSKLTAEQRKFYEENGYIVVKNMVAEKDIEIYNKRFRDIANGVISPPFGMVIQKDITIVKEAQNENTVYKLQELFTDEVLFGYCKYGPILDYAQGFCGPNIMAIHTMLINKPPDAGNKSTRHPLHQDLHYFPFRPADRIVCAWTAMERINRANGCLVAIPGSHKGEHLPHDYPDWEGGVNKFYYGIKDLSQMDKRVHVEMETGDTILFHPLLIHGSGINVTNGFRKAISCHFAASECEYIDVKGTIQENLAEEILDLARKKGFPIDDYQSIWKLRARLVRGVKMNL